MPNIIELNLLNNKSIVATMQGHPLANENSYKIVAGEENATKFIIKSIPNQYANARLTVEMVNSQGLGIAERELSEIEVDLVSYKGFILPVGMAVAGYGYVSIKAYIGDEVAVFQPLKLKVWNTLPNWKDGVDKTANVKVVDGYLILTENGNEYNLGYVQGDKGDKGERGEKGDKGDKGDSGTTVLVGGKAVAEFDADTKLDKVSEPLSGSIDSRVYTISPNGSQGTLLTSAVRQGNTIARYNARGALNTNTPNGEYDAANKKYVDEQVKEIHCISIYSEEVMIFFYLPTEKGVSFSTVSEIWDYLEVKGIVYNGQDDRVGLPASGVIFGKDKWHQIAFIVADRNYAGVTAVGAETSYNLYHNEQVIDIIM